MSGLCFELIRPGVLPVRGESYQFRWGGRSFEGVGEQVVVGESLEAGNAYGIGRVLIMSIPTVSPTKCDVTELHNLSYFHSTLFLLSFILLLTTINSHCSCVTLRVTRFQARVA